jgi:hypothetical protein
MPTRECDLNNRPNKTSRYRDAPARTMPNLFARTLRPLNRICRNARAPLAESDFLADRIAFIQSNKVIQQLKASNECKGLPHPEAAPTCQDWFARSIFSRGEVP